MLTGTSRLSVSLAALTFIALAVSSCGGREESAAPAMAAPAAAAAPAPAPKPTDPQIAHIAYTAGVIDIKAARLALQKSHNRQIRAFANEMIRDHTAVNNKATALLKKLHVTPEDNDTSRTITQQADQEYATLSGLKGREFDKAYIDNEVAYHQNVNNALQNTLIPDAQNPELKSLLESGLKIFQGHEQHAEQIAGQMK